jgi:hypothetical protein
LPQFGNGLSQDRIRIHFNSYSNEFPFLKHHII